uniref:Protein kinase domain-containing protein n=1 Tax=viral metagenome TaxID=1070528 RepID=A0A6C0HAF1_9ZZZZ
MTTRKHKKKIKERTRKNATRKKYGGKVFESGGYGCLFSPPLKCKNISNMNLLEGTYVTKLMKKKYAKQEYDEISKFEKILKNIPNYEDYFLVKNFELCIPEKLTKEDLIHFNENCSALSNDELNKKNINEKIHEFEAIQMPFGGIDIFDYVYKIRFDNSKMIQLNQTLINLLKNGIVKMNELGVYHGDIKDSNVLISKKNNSIRARLIDWGLSKIYKGEEKIPDVFSNRPFQYNLPFSCILLSRHFRETCVNFLNTTPNPSHSELKEFIHNYLKTKRHFSKHLIHIHRSIQVLFKKEFFIHKHSGKSFDIKYAYEYICNYLLKILEKYIKNGTFHVMEYFKQVYLKNLDVWGFVSIYTYFIDYITNKNRKYGIKHFKSAQLKLVNKVKDAYSLLLNSPDKAVDINSLVKILNDLNPLFNDSLREEFKPKEKSIFKLFDYISGNKMNHSEVISENNKSKIVSSKKNTSKNTTKKRMMTHKN